MSNLTSIDHLYGSLIDQYQGDNPEFEVSFFESLFRDHQYKVVLLALQSNKFKVTDDIIKEIRISGDVGLYQYLFSIQKLQFDLDVMELAVKSGNLETVQWLRANGCPWNELTCGFAAANGHLEVLQWCRSQDPPCPWNELTCGFATANGHLEVLQWCRANGCPWNEATCAYAAANGYLEVLQWCRENGCPWAEGTCAYAAHNGHLEVLQWCRSQDPPCPWDERTCAYAAMNEHLAVLQWCRSQDPPCPWDEKTYAYTSINGHLEVLRWSIQNGCPYNLNDLKSMNFRPAIRDYLDTLPS